MSWFFSKPTNESRHSFPPTTPLQQQRLNQIKSLQHCHSNIVEVQRDVEYRVTFKVGDNNISLNIFLPTNFPYEKPIVTVSPKLKHPWVNQQMIVVDSPGLNTFYVHSDFGKVIQDIMKEFKKNPPQFIYGLPPVSSHGPTTLYNDTQAENIVKTITTSLPDRPPHYSEKHKVITTERSFKETIQADISSIMDKLQQLKKDELENICNNEDLFLEYIQNMETLAELQSRRTKLIEENEAIAIKNLEIENELVDQQGNLKELTEERDDLYHKFQTKAQYQDKLLQMYEIGNIFNNLRISILEAEEESEKVAVNFLSGTLNLDNFIVNFLEKRKLSHLRRAKEEILKTAFT